MRGSRLRTYYREFSEQDRSRSYPDTGSLLSATLEHAVAHVPYYRTRASLGKIRTDPFEALSDFPILTKDTIRAEGDRLLSDLGDRGRWQKNTSGGSTGEPVLLLQDRDHLARTVAIRNVYSSWAGGTLGAPELYIWGSEQDLLEGQASFQIRFGNRLLQRTLLNAFMLTDESMLQILSSIQRGPPRLVIAYAQAAYEVARFAADQGWEIPPQRGLIATAGTLYGFMREQLEATFGCKTLNRYGSRETGDMAGECEHRRGLHVLPWCCHIEVLGEDDTPVEPGEEGEIVVTGFTNRAMPLIRYRIGDRARVPAESTPCPCGRATQMLESVTGRVVDMFIGADGRMVDGEYFTHLLYYRPWLKQFQVVQTAPDEVLYRVVAANGIPEEDRQEIIANTKAVFGAGCTVAFEEVDAITPNVSGKLRYTIRAF